MAVTNVTEEEDLMIINRSGITIRLRVSDLRVIGRATQGVKLIDLRGKDYIASITKVPAEEESTQQPAAGEGNEGAADNTEMLESNKTETNDTNL